MPRHAGLAGQPEFTSGALGAMGSGQRAAGQGPLNRKDPADQPDRHGGAVRHMYVTYVFYFVFRFVVDFR